MFSFCESIQFKINNNRTVIIIIIHIAMLLTHDTEKKDENIYISAGEIKHAWKCETIYIVPQNCHIIRNFLSDWHFLQNDAWKSSSNGSKTAEGEIIQINHGLKSKSHWFVFYHWQNQDSGFLSVKPRSAYCTCWPIWWVRISRWTIANWCSPDNAYHIPIILDDEQSHAGWI